MRFVCVLWIIVACAGTVIAQSPPAAPVSPKPGSVAGGANATLEAKPLVAEALGLKIRLPLGSNVVAEKVNDRLVLAISDDALAPTWSMRIQLLASSNPASTPQTQIDDLLAEFKAKGQTLTVLSKGPVTIGEVAGQRCYIQRTNAEGEPYVSGWVILPSGLGTFLVFAIQTLPEYLPALLPTLDASLATLELRSTEDVASERMARLGSGKALLDSVTPEQLKKLVGLSQWFRIHSPGTADRPAAEVGYSLLEVVEAQRGALNPQRAENTFDANERTPGFMVRVQGRILVSRERKIYYDSIALYWMAWDQSEEAWSIRGTHRQGDAEQSEAETGLRTPAKPDAKAFITVIKTDDTTRSREPYEWEVPDVYLSQPLGWVLGKLLPRDVQDAREYGYYFYNFANATPQVSQRVDTWEPDGNGRFRLTTRLSPDAPVITAIYDREGALVQRTHADGSITEPIELEELRRLWKSKGLQVGSASK